MRRRDAGWALVALLAASGIAQAAEITDVASSFDDDNPFDFRLRLGYDYTQKSAAIKREHEGDAGQESINVYKDLYYQNVRHSMNVRAEIGIFQDLGLVVEMPFVISDSSTISYDQRLGSGCVYTASPGITPNCVNADNSTTTMSDSPTGTAGGPSSYIVPANGYDALNSTAGSQVGFMQGSDMVFRGPHRGGGSDSLDTINLALNWGILSQKRDDTKPNWVIGVEYDVSIGNVMKFNRDFPDLNHGVSDGLDRLKAKMALSHRFKYVDPYVSFWWEMPIVRRKDTLFQDFGSTEKNSAPQMSAGTVFGFEGILWERPQENYKIYLDLNGRVSAKFDGRGYSEAWEMFASSPALACDPMWNPACDTTQTTNNYQGQPFNGITAIENYASVGGELALGVQAGKYVRFRAHFMYQKDQSHFITIDDVGEPDTAGSRVSQAHEFNPAYRPIIDEVGRRYKVDDIDIFNVGLWGQLMF